MIASLLKNYFRLKVMAILTKLILHRKNGAVPSATKVTIVGFIIEELVNRLFTLNKQNKRETQRDTNANAGRKGRTYDAER